MKKCTRKTDRQFERTNGRTARKAEIGMIRSITKEKIPAQYCYMLKTKQLESLLKINEVNMHIDLCYTRGIGPTIDAFFWLPNENISYDRLYVRVGVLPKEEMSQAKAKIEEIVLPEFAIWLKSILALVNNSEYIRHDARFFAEYRNQKIGTCSITK